MGNLITLAQDNSQPVLFMMQPAPAFAKQLTKEELEVVGELDYRDPYKAMIDSLFESHPKYLRDLRDVFAYNKGTVYIDHIHLTTEGKKALIHRISDEAARAWGWRKK